MIKIDYEGAWKELKREYGKEYIVYEGGEDVEDVMKKLEKKHTHNFIDIRKRSDKEIADYCMKKYAEMYAENVHLKKKLGDKKEKNKVFKVHIIGLTDDNYEYDFTEQMNDERLAYYDRAFREGKKAKYRGEKIRIVQLDVSF